MSVLTINGATNAMPEGERRSWVLACTDVFGRPYELTLTAYRGGAEQGIGVQSPTGEYGFVDVNHVPDLLYALAEASRFLGVGVGSCTPRR